MRQIFYSSFLFFVMFGLSAEKTFAQNGSVGIGTTTPNTNASLDLGAANKGLLINRVALTAANSPSPLAAHVAGMLIYNTATAGTSPNNVSPGIYFNDGSRWVRYVPVPEGLFARSAGTQVINGAATITDWAVVTNNFGSAWNGSVFTVPAGMQGWYSISASYTADQNYAGGLRTPAQHVAITVNSAIIAQGTNAVSITGGLVSGNAPGTGSANASVNYYLNAGDQVAVIGNHLSYLVSNNATTPAPAYPPNTYLSILKQ